MVPLFDELVPRARFMKKLRQPRSLLLYRYLLLRLLHVCLPVSQFETAKLVLFFEIRKKRNKILVYVEKKQYFCTGKNV